MHEKSNEKPSSDTDIEEVFVRNEENKTKEISDVDTFKEESSNFDYKFTAEFDEEESTIKFQPGVLDITVQKAANLQNNDKFSKSDPYVKIKYGKDEFRSQTISNNLNPEWNFTCSFDILDETEEYIHINVYDDDFGKDNFQGCYSLPARDAVKTLTKQSNWFNLIGCESG